jgi:hypothetical protein
MPGEPMLRSPDAIVFGPDRPLSSILDQAQYLDEDDGDQD